MKQVFGPVPSRRLGQSLGIDPIPFKTCNWNCVYCQLGRTRPLRNERRPYFSVRGVVREVCDAISRHREHEIDWITFIGSGEPTLNSLLGDMILGVKAVTAIPVAVITNGSLLHDPAVRQELLLADAVMPSLDAGSADLYRRVTRPHPALSFERHVEGLTAFRREYPGQLWVEVMLLKGINDGDEALADMARCLAEIHPDAVHVSLPVRPPAEGWVEPPDDETMERARTILGTAAKSLRPVAGEFDLSGFDNVVDAVVAVISRHPMEEEQLMRTLKRWRPGDVGKAIGKLAADGRAQVVIRYGRRYWSSAQAGYAKA